MHPEVIEDKPGTCPKCGMELVPMSPDRAAALGLTEPEPEEKKERKILYWRSSMNPSEIYSQPGKDSMGMDLVPVYEDEVAAGSAIRIDPVMQQNMGIRVDKVIEGPVVKSVRTVGFVAYDETSETMVTTKVSGWVEKLYVDQTGVQVHEGDPLFELYSPELFSAQEEYLAALRHARQAGSPLLPRSAVDAEALVRDARQRLEFFDVPRDEIERLEKTGRVRKTLTIRAPFTGIVVEKFVREGQRIGAGENLFHIADLSTVWVIAKIYEQDLPYVRLGQEALMRLSYLPGRTFRGRVTYVYPYLEAKTREVSVRMEFHNPGYQLKPGMFATVFLRSEDRRKAILVPDVAVIDTGERAIAFVVRRPGVFEPREVVVGRRSEGNYLEVLSGLAPGETVVVSGQFLLDSESRIREAALQMLEPGEVPAAAPIRAVTKKHEHPEAEKEGELFYVCPMPEHADILYDKPGKCPLCGMNLVPSRHTEGVSGPGVAYWTCPMPEHAHVREKGPGKCPICGMSLVPVYETDAPHAHEETTHAHEEGAK
ncbi:MAG: hypothetical protein KatS3mg076_3291 [Candidatus Binatia bacterium]|nr:MAG: hypothetical protein KatS3mg076_3291 [Candidatus Binatia bacterium]